MDESEAKVLIFDLKEAVKALTEYALKEGLTVPPFEAWEIRLNAQTGQLFCTLYGPTAKFMANLPTVGSA